jgi:hypothetical protein
MEVGRSARNSLLALLLVAVSAARAWAGAPGSPPHLDLAAALASWEKHASAAEKLQGECTIRTSSQSAKRPTERRYENQYEVQQSPSGVRISLTGRFPPAVECYISNAKYAAEIGRKDARAENVLLVDWKMDPSFVLHSARLPLRSWAMLVLCPHFTHLDIALPDLVSSPDFHVKRVGPEVKGGASCVRLDYQFTEWGDRRDNPHQHEGTAWLDPSAGWCVRESENTMTTPDGQSRRLVTNHFSQPLKGFPIVQTRKEIATGTSKKAGRVSFTHDHEYRVAFQEDVPNELFTLSSFGLPEPVGVTWTKPRWPLYLWGVGGSVVCAGLALLFWRFRSNAKPTTPEVLRGPTRHGIP